jgi:aldehyde:ferredoxin oxidoreductase
MLIDYEDRLNIFDTLVFCRFYRDLYTWEELEKVISMATGRPSSKADLILIARNIADMTRQFNLNEGLQPQDDRLPRRMHAEALPGGNAISQGDMERLLSDYYRLRGWDSQGVPLAD